MIKIGTRGSPLALRQAQLFIEALQQAHSHNNSMATVQKGLEFEIIPIRTSADMIVDLPLAEFGGKQLFTKEIDSALLSHKIDFAVHSLKDLETTLPDGITLSAYLPRANPYEAFLSRHRFEDLPPGAKIGSCSVRRAAQIFHLRPDLQIIPLRGNINTRIRKLEQGECDGTFLALAGIERLGLNAPVIQTMTPEEMLPAAGQGTLVAACRSDDKKMQQLLSSVNHSVTEVCSKAERSFLRQMYGSCRSPLAAYAIVENDVLWLRGLKAEPDTLQNLVIKEIRGSAKEFEKLGADLAEIVGPLPRAEILAS